MTTTNKTNPLEGYLRTPKLYVVLPSQGKFSKLDSQSQITGEIPIFPMTAKDETMLRNPDALLNGESLVSVIRSVTGIEDVYNLSSNDVDVILLAARYATFGAELGVESKCPKWASDHTFDVNIEAILESVADLEDEYVVTLDNGLVVYVRPYTFQDTRKAALQAFRETNELNKLTQGESDEIERLLTFNKSFQAMADLNIEILANSVVKVVIPGEGEEEPTVVDNPEHILNWVRGIGKNHADAILDEANTVNDAGVEREVTIKCPESECEHEYQQRLEFNPSSFFDIGS